MHRTSDDIDLATDASVEEVQRIFPKTIPVGVNFGIVIVVEDGHQFEVATFRKDQGYLDGRRPTGIEKADAEEDAKRRDFTINGMFYNPLTQEIFEAGRNHGTAFAEHGIDEGEKATTLFEKGPENRQLRFYEITRQAGDDDERRVGGHSSGAE